IEWASEQGIEQNGRWEVRRADGGTELTWELEFHLVGPLSPLVERLAARVIARHMEASLLAARRVLERAPGRRAQRAPARKKKSEPTEAVETTDAGAPADAGTDGGPSHRLPRRTQLARSLDIAHPKVVATLRRPGVLHMSQVVALRGS